ncbi:MAG: DUF5320 domain-containing protein [Candidatus Thorarchaeota archaeon]
MVNNIPGGDKTGPAGLGSKTGRGLGYCVGYDTPGFIRAPGGGGAWGARIWDYLSYGRLIPWGRGGRDRCGRGGYFRRGGRGIFYNLPIYSFAAELTEEQKLSTLKQDKDYLEYELDTIQSALKDVSKRIEDLEKQG